MEETQKKSKTTLWTVLILVLAVITFGAIKYTKKDAPVVVDENNNTNTGEEKPLTQTTSYLYKDGSYSFVGQYTSPAGPEEIAVSLVLKDDVVVDATVVSKATHEISKKMQGLFVGGFKTQVVGKKIDDVVLDKVSGSSLTPKGWNDAVAKIKAVAKS